MAELLSRAMDALMAGRDSIEEIEPDEIDLKMINEIRNDPDCHVFE